MQKLLKITTLILFIFSTTLAQSPLPKCEGSENKINTFSLKDPKQMGTIKKWKDYIKHYKQTRKWTNCQGKGMGPRGEEYVGEWKNGKFSGQGTFTHEGRVYVGNWKKGKKHGQGTYKYPNGDMYIGQWIESKYSKEGTYIYANGDKYIGEWKKKEYHLPDNQKERHGSGMYIFKNGDRYVGKWKKGLKHGKGTFIYANGNKKKQTWKKDELIK